MTVARALAEFLTQVFYVDLPPQTVDHAAMLIASTIASAALGSGIASSKITRALARERGGTPDASLWFDPGPKLPVADAARGILGGSAYFCLSKGRVTPAIDRCALVTRRDCRSSF
ncbi:MAG: hypothetical protein ACRERE_44680 [Candidatus Entotheonellia bacterium]